MRAGRKGESPGSRNYAHPAHQTLAPTTQRSIFQSTGVKAWADSTSVENIKAAHCRTQGEKQVRGTEGVRLGHKAGSKTGDNPTKVPTTPSASSQVVLNTIPKACHRAGQLSLQPRGEAARGLQFPKSTQRWQDPNNLGIHMPAVLTLSW